MLAHKCKRIISILLISAICIGCSGCADAVLGTISLLVIAAELDHQNSLKQQSALAQNTKPVVYSTERIVTVTAAQPQQNTGSLPRQASSLNNSNPNTRDTSTDSGKPQVSKFDECMSLSSKAYEGYTGLDWKLCSLSSKRILENDHCSSRDKFNAAIFLGAIDFQNGFVYQAKDNFLRAHRFDSNLVPSEVLFPPAMVDFYREVTRR